MLFVKFSVLILLALVSASSAYHYNDAGYYDANAEQRWKDAPRYPDYCCPLEWVNITQGDELPKDFIVAGYIDGTEYAFTRDNWKNVAIKSKDKNEEALKLWYAVPNPFPILTNPNKCSIGWYKTKYWQEIPSYDDSNIFYPTTGWTQYGSYARNNGTPGILGDVGEFHFFNQYKNGTEILHVPGIEFLYVKCNESLKMMSTSKLIKISLDHNLLENLTLSDKVVKMMKTYKNHAYSPVNMNFKFGLNLINRVDISTIKPHRLSISTNDDTYLKWQKNYSLSGFINEILLMSKMSSKASKMFHVEDAIGDGKKIFSARHEDDSFSNEHHFNERIEIPSASSATVTAYTQSYKAKIPIELVYEVTPIKAGDNLVTQRALELSLEKFGTQKKIEPSDKGTLLLYFDAVLDIDTGHEVSFDIETTPLEKLTFSEGKPIDNGTIFD